MKIFRYIKIGFKPARIKKIKFVKLSRPAKMFRQNLINRSSERWQQYPNSYNDEKKTFAEALSPKKEALHNQSGPNHIEESYLLSHEAINYYSKDALRFETY